jgi:hypothetical protein
MHASLRSSCAARIRESRGALGLAQSYQEISKMGESRWAVGALLRVGLINLAFGRVEEIEASNLPCDAEAEAACDASCCIRAAAGFVYQDSGMEHLQKAVHLAAKLGLDNDPSRCTRAVS